MYLALSPLLQLQTFSLSSPLIDWLVDRRHCEFKWHSDAKLVRDRLAIAVRNLPSSEQLYWVRDIEGELNLMNNSLML